MRLPAGGFWSLHEVTADLEAAGEEARQAQELAQTQRLKDAAKALAKLVATHEADGHPVLKTDAEVFLCQQGLRRKDARALFAEKTGTLWRVEPLPGGKGKGKPAAVLPMPSSEDGGS